MQSATLAGLVVLGLVSGAAGMVGVYLDTAWHRSVGRDSFFILPHLFIYGGGLGVLAAALGGIALATRTPGAVGGPVWRLGRLHLPAGFSVTALGIGVIMAAAPVDAWWHATFGKDVLIWSPPHLQLHLGAGITALGLLFAVAAERGRGVFARPWLWRAAMLAVLVDLVHRGHFVLAHYTMLAHSRTPDLYPFLVALLAPVVLVAAARAVGPWAPTLACLAFLGAAWLMDVMLRLIDYERYTLTPVLAVPAAALSLVFQVAGRRRGRAWVAVGAALAFTGVFLVTEVAWMRWGVSRPWSLDLLLAALPRTLIAGVGSGWVGWVVGGFLRVAVAPTGSGAAAAEFGGRGRARAAAAGALALSVLGLTATYAPQRYGPPMTVAELKLEPAPVFPYTEAIFWNAFFAAGWPFAAGVEARSEGIIDGLPMPVGPAWCAPTEAALATALPDVRFRMEVNGTPVDLSPYPLVRLRLRDGAHCAWVGVASASQRASQNRFVYTIAHPAAGGPATTRVELGVTFKDP
ncbi:MAG: hypothetical protein A2X36_02085 [Elusimicrobia bacterium GWA2_69_24]|nr:MAG: hypothetical protein A2X52_06610 [Candidatus Rokubacteria bacterium GWC2_70_16]OGK95217.1 MAG: hypothetical protein A2W08_16830 [Candidatus Rokubacteria bacterium RBG_16_73_20]OGR60841.1 MAG: hypothetical protein A2X36_02085 [Elusimicrobia bacterium GWA2_69_24]HBH00826.1 hypothetical protein [Candidatus Rokubacteria bacterium]